MEFVLIAIGAVALAAWVFTLFHWIMAVRHRRADLGLGTFIANGIAAFDSSNFNEQGKRHSRLMAIGFVTFFATVLIGAALGALVVD